MSTARHELDERSTDSTPRCSLEVARHPTGVRGAKFCGTARAPRYADELGAMNVLELLMDGGRLLFFRVAGEDLAEIRRLPARKE